MTLEDRISALIRREGGYVNNPADAGGPTKYGVTQAKLSQALGRPASVADVVSLTEVAAREIYRRDFAAAGLETAPEAVHELLLDVYANHGPGNFARIVQRSLAVKVDGVFGPKTRAALAVADGPHLYREICAARLEFTGRIITGNLKDDDRDGIPDHTEFAAGWLNRQAEFVRATP